MDFKKKIVLLILLFNFISVNCGHAMAEQNNSGQKFAYGIKMSAGELLIPEKIETYFKICAELNVSYLKIGILWDLLIPAGQEKPVWKGYFKSHLKRLRYQENQPHINNFDFDYIAQLSQKYNISIFPAFMGQSQDREREINPEKFAEFVYLFISRYKNKMNIQYIEFHNEPSEGNNLNRTGNMFKGTAEQLVAVNNATYKKIKSEYPDILVGSSGFCTGSSLEAEKYTIPFLKRYFSAHPEFDFFALHDYPKELSRTQGVQIGDFISTYHTFDTYRRFLSDFGYSDKPIFITEGFDDKPMRMNGRIAWNWADEEEASILMLESFIHALSNAEKNNVIGKILTGIKTNRNNSMGLIDRSNGKIRGQYYYLKYLLQQLRCYPIYSGRIAGEINSEKYWIEEFKNKIGKRMWVAFVPLNYETTLSKRNLQPAVLKKKIEYPQKIRINFKGLKEVIVSKVSYGEIVSTKQKVNNGNIELTIGKNPVFLEEEICLEQ
jgi:hypothetical protein